MFKFRSFSPHQTSEFFGLAIACQQGRAKAIFRMVGEPIVNHLRWTLLHVMDNGPIANQLNMNISTREGQEFEPCLADSTKAN
jgi:hypothetical protein